MRGSSEFVAYLVLLLVTSATMDVGEDYDYPYTNFFPELSNQLSGLDTTDADPDEIHELRCADCKAVPKLATVRDDDSLLFRSTTLSPIVAWINASGADRRSEKTTVVKKRGGVPWPYASDSNHMETDVFMIPLVNRIRTSRAAPHRIFDFRWNDLIKKTTQIPQ